MHDVIGSNCLITVIISSKILSHLKIKFQKRFFDYTTNMMFGERRATKQSNPGQ